MNKLLIIIALASMSIFACKPAADSSKEQTADQEVRNDDGTKAEKHFGEKINAGNTISINQMIAGLAGKDSLVTKIEGTVESVCQVKGCWMNLVPEGGDAEQSVFVKFKDYGFFMPLDLAGQKVALQGVAYREVTTVDELKHYAEDEGLSKEEIEKITEPKEELKFMADGVIIL